MLSSTQIARKTIKGNVGKTKCGNCGKVGHNKRTCNATSMKQSATVNKPKISKPQKVEELTGRNIITHWDEHLKTLNKEHNGESLENEKSTEDKSYTLEEIETLWLLKNGQDGKMGKGKSKYWGQNRVWTDKDNDNLFEFIQDVESTPQGAPTKVWYKFFKGLGATAKEEVLKKYADDLSSYIANTQTAAFPYVKNRIEANKEKPQLPMKLFPVFAKDSSIIVRCSVAEKEGLPVEVRKLLVEDKKIDVVSIAVRSTKTPSEILEYAEARTEEDHPKTFSTGSRHWSYFNKVSSLRHAIAENPNITDKLFTKYADEGFPGGVHVHAPLFVNKAIPETKIHAHYWSAVKNLEAVRSELSVLENTMERDIQAGTHTNSNHPLVRSVARMKREERNLRAKSHNILSSGRAPLQVTLDALDNNLKIMEGGFQSSDPWQAEYRASLLLSRAERLTSEHFKKYSEVFMRNGNVEAMTGLLKNPQVPAYTVENIRKWSEGKLNMGTGKVYQIRNLRAEAERRLEEILY